MRLITRSVYKFSTNFHRIANFDPEIQDLHSVIRKFAEEKVAPLADKTDKDDKFPHHLWR